MSLRYLDFDFSEDAEGTGTFDAMACVGPAQVPAVHAEIARVLGWAHAEFAHACAPLEEGGAWHYDLQEIHETATPHALRFDPATGELSSEPESPGAPRITLTLSISGGAAFCAALREAFELD
jgi:hypothetical protein